MLAPDFAAVRYFFNYRFPCMANRAFANQTFHAARKSKKVLRRMVLKHIYSFGRAQSRRAIRAIRPSSGSATKKVFEPVRIRAK
ncbi:hypothetical protein [Paraburkholderia atlantica]|uniref:hypothetical protein n=1 Tax=Paraburkholderia atlantica TaxID=2654982 RepID=UPI001C86359A|nr:hypothetical protein [Paraburkholderia atlantica]